MIHNRCRRLRLKIECRGIIVTTNNLYQTQRKGTFEKPEMSPYKMEPNS